MSGSGLPHSLAIIKIVFWCSLGPINGFIWAMKQHSQLDGKFKRKNTVKMWTISKETSTVFQMEIYLQEPTSSRRKHQNALHNAENEKINETFRILSCQLTLKIINEYDQLLLFDRTYPRFGPFGAKIGNTIPTKPHRAVITNTGRAPIVFISN